MQTKESDLGEAKQTLEVLFMPYINHYLEVYNLPPFGERSLNGSVQGTPHTETQEPRKSHFSKGRA
jgi:hypothetical protein